MEEENKKKKDVIDLKSLDVDDRIYIKNLILGQADTSKMKIVKPDIKAKYRLAEEPMTIKVPRQLVDKLSKLYEKGLEEKISISKEK